MEKYRTAKAGDPRGGVVIDFDDEIVEMVIAPQSITIVAATEFQRSIVMPAGWVFTPGVVRTNGANRQKGLRPRVAVGAPPQALWQKSPLWGPTIALAFVGDDATPTQGNRDRVRAGHEPAPARVTGRGTDR